MLTRLLTLTLLLPAAALAQPKGPQPPAGAPMRPLNEEERAEMRERVIRRIKTMRAVEIAEILDLDDAAAVQLSRKLSDYDQKRVELMMRMREARRRLHDAAQGDKTVVPINEAQQLFIAQSELANLQRREFDELSRGVAPEKLARLALYLHQFDKRIMKMAREVRERGRPGPHGPPMGPPPPGGWDDD